jgi:hypothetical protein
MTDGEAGPVAYTGHLPPLVVAIARADGDVVGAGFLISADTLVTCGHVVRDASADTSQNAVTIRLAGDQDSRPVEATIIRVLGSDQEEQSRDVALLRLPGPVSGYKPDVARLADRADVYGLKLRAFGFPDGLKVGAMVGDHVDLVGVGPDARGLLQLKAGDKTIKKGFSGGAVRDGDEVLGMLVTMRDAGREGFMIPAMLLARHIREAMPEPSIEVRSSAASKFDHVDNLRSFIRSELERAAGHTGAHLDLFATKAAFCDTVDQIIKAHHGETTGLRSIPHGEMLEAASNKTVYLQAPGGLGKTFYLLRVLLAAIDADRVPFYLDARRAKTKYRAGDDGVEELFDECTQQGGRWSIFLKAIGAHLPVIVVIDGLNESTHSTTNIMGVIDHLARNYVPTLVVADRMSGVEPRLGQFQRATILPLPADVAESRIPEIMISASSALRKVLSIPFFLDLYERILRTSVESQTGPRRRADVMLAYLALCDSGDAQAATIVERGKKLASRLAPIAFEAYRIGSVRIETKWLKDKLGNEAAVIERLKDAGMLVAAGDQHVAFRHQLFHDFLAGYHLKSSTPAEWRGSAFDLATLRAKSFDALEFTAELLNGKANDFIIEVYDWNYSAAITCVLDLEAGVTGEASPLSASLRDALIALNADKRFDHFAHTRQRAERRAATITSASAIAHREAPTRDALVECVRTAYLVDPEFPMALEWKRLFTLPGKPDSTDWALLQHTPLLAWTAANAFRPSISAADPLVDYLIRLYDALYASQPEDERAIATRWRIVHILGAVNREEAVATLVRAIRNEKVEKAGWIRYGAARSLAEIASRTDSAEAAARILGHVIAVMDQLVGSPAFNELRDVAVIAESSPAWWPSTYRTVIEKGLELARSTGLDSQELDLWKTRLQDLTGLGSQA